jgi:GAF domain
MSNEKISDWLNQTPEDKNNWLQEGLELGCHYLGLETGIVSNITDGMYVIQAVYSTIGDIFTPGMKFELKDTYCEAVVQKNEIITYIQVGKIPDMVLHPVYKAVQLESYIGLPLHNKQKQIAGTLNFSSHIITQAEFNSKDIELLKKMAMKIEQVFDF